MAPFSSLTDTVFKGAHESSSTALASMYQETDDS